jgi:hypothetical protein
MKDFKELKLIHDNDVKYLKRFVDKNFGDKI